MNVGYGNFDVIRIDFFQEREAAFEAFKKGDITYREEFTSLTWATGYDFPGDDRGQGEEDPVPGRDSAVDAGLLLQHAPGEIRRSAHAAGDRPRLRLRMGEPQPFLRFLHARVLLLPAVGLHGEGQAGRGRVEAAGAIPRRPAGGSVRRGLCAAEDRRLGQRPRDPEAGLRPARRGRLDAEGRPAGRRQGRGARGRVPHRRLRLRARAVAVDRQSQAHRRRRDASARSTRRNISRGSTTSTSTSILAASSSARRRSTACSQFFGTKAADMPGAATMPASRTRRSTRCSTSCRGRQPRGAGHAARKPSTGCCRAGQYWVPSWYQADHRVAHWDMFGWPAKKPDYAFTPETTWWFDRDKAAAIGMADRTEWPPISCAAFSSSSRR